MPGTQSCPSTGSSFADWIPIAFIIWTTLQHNVIMPCLKRFHTDKAFPPTKSQDSWLRARVLESDRLGSNPCSATSNWASSLSSPCFSRLQNGDGNNIGGMGGGIRMAQGLVWRWRDIIYTFNKPRLLISYLFFVFRGSCKNSGNCEQFNHTAQLDSGFILDMRAMF